MTIRIIDRRTNEELSLRAFGVAETSDGHFIFGWEHYSYVRNPDDVNDDNYDVTFPEVEELKEWNHTLNKLNEEAVRRITYKNIQLIDLKSRIADLELEVAGQQKIIEENMGFGSTVTDKK